MYKVIEIKPNGERNTVAINLTSKLATEFCRLMDEISPENTYIIQEQD